MGGSQPGLRDFRVLLAWLELEEAGVSGQWSLDSRPGQVLGPWGCGWQLLAHISLEKGSSCPLLPDSPPSTCQVPARSSGQVLVLLQSRD